MLRLLLVAALTAFAPTAHAADARQMEENKKVVVEFYELAINQKNFEAASKLLGSRYPAQSQRRRRARRTESLYRLPAREISRQPQRHQTHLCRWRLRHPACP